ncbi:MAG: hypothetical protein WAN30_04090 [Acidimicrobiales bacterium]
MTDSPTRRELEQSIRALLPSELTASKSMRSQAPSGAAAGIGGLFTGYAWGWLRGRKRRRSRKNRAS